VFRNIDSVDAPISLLVCLAYYVCPSVYPYSFLSVSLLLSLYRSLMHSLI